MHLIDLIFTVELNDSIIAVCRFGPESGGLEEYVSKPQNSRCIFNTEVNSR